MSKQKIYTTFSFFKRAVAGTGVILAGLLLIETFFQPGFLLPVIGLIGLAFVILIFRIVQLIYKLQLDRVHDVNQVESLLWLYQQFQPQLAFPPMRVVAGSPDFFKVIIEACQEHQPRVILEAGSGVSSVVISEWLRAGQRDARHYALDHLEKYAGETAERVKNANSQVVLAPLTPYELEGKKWQWYDIAPLANVSEIDLFIIDGPPENIQRLARYPALPLLWEKLSEDVVIILDDTNRPDEQAIIKKWCATYGLEHRYLYTEKGTTILTRKSAE